MAIDIKSPQFPESIFEGTLSTWLKKEGQEIKQDEVLAEIETDKVVIEVTAPSDGVMGKIIIDEGATIQSSEIIGTYDDVKGSKPSEVVKEEKIEEEPKAEEAVSPPPAPAPIKEEVKEPASEVKKRITVLEGSAPLYMIQLAAFRSAKRAAEMAEILSQKHKSRLKDVNLETMRVDNGSNGIFHRIVSIPLLRQDADKLCSILRRSGQDCFLRKYETTTLN